MSESAQRDQKTAAINSALLVARPLPMPDTDGDKEQRGRVLIVAGSPEIPGAAILAADAALRAGAGKLTVAISASIAPVVALAVPEARVIPLSQTASGALQTEAASLLDDMVGKLDAVLIGPGMQNDAGTLALVQGALARFSAAHVILDACAMDVVRTPLKVGVDTDAAAAPYRFAQPVLMTPHAGEMAHLTGEHKETICADPAAAALRAASGWNAVVALKGANTWLADPDGDTWHHAGANSGLAISGSGDTLAGIIAGLAARGAPLQQAAAWGIALHARAGDALAQRIGPLGFFARELAAEVPQLMHRLQTAA